MVNLWQALILFGQFFTKINIPIVIDNPVDKFRTKIQYITLFGLLLGLLEALFFWGLTFIYPLWLAWLGYWILDGIITGGFHLDALADTADGLFSSKTPDRIFKIMKDSRIGTMGSLALIYYYLVALGASITICRYLSVIKLVMLTAILTMLTKTGLSLLFYQMKYVGNKQGLASIWLNVRNWQIIFAQLFSAIVIFVAFNWQGIVSYFFMVICAYSYRKYIIHILGGFSGDTLGAFASLAPVLFLLFLTAILRITQ